MTISIIIEKKLLFVIDDNYTDILIRNLYWKPVDAY